jgi:hypothetical protein
MAIAATDSVLCLCVRRGLSSTLAACIIVLGGFWKGAHRKQAACLLLILSVASGCTQRNGPSVVLSSAGGRSSPQGLTLDLMTAPVDGGVNAAYASTPGHTHGSAARVPRGIRGNVDPGDAQELLAKATLLLDGPIIELWRIHTDWSSRRVFMVRTRQGETAIFLEKDGKWAHLNSGAELIGINEILQDYRFARDDFANPPKVHLFLHEVAVLHRGVQLMLGSSITLLRLGSCGLEARMRGTETNEEVMRSLCHDPEFSFSGDIWSVRFNVFTENGAVDEWTVIGQHDPRRNVNEIWRIRILPVKPPGTFSWVPR